jgi:hypothetical protein
MSSLFNQERAAKAVRVTPGESRPNNNQPEALQPAPGATGDPVPALILAGVAL